VKLDYRIPQILHTMGCMLYSPPLERDVRKKIAIKSKSTWEVELRGKILPFPILLRDY
jgi:hypothetical protein